MSNLVTCPGRIPGVSLAVPGLYRQHWARGMPQHSLRGAPPHRIEKTLMAGGRHGDEVGLLRLRCLQDCADQSPVRNATGTMAPSEIDRISGTLSPMCSSSIFASCSMVELTNSLIAANAAA